MKILRSIYPGIRFFIGLYTAANILILGYIYYPLFLIGQFVLLLWSVIFIYEAVRLYAGKGNIKATRLCAARFSNGDENTVELIVENRFPFDIKVKIIDEIPFQFQKRDVQFVTELKPRETKKITYNLRPVERGEYDFGAINIYVSGHAHLVSRRIRAAQNQMVKVYPSYLQLQKYELYAIHNQLNELGIKKIRRIGHNIEFEQIKEYVKGDDFRTINWKATARRNELMVNVYQDEKSQNVYSLIDKGRQMKMPFEGLSLLDYAINSSLVISSIAIRKEDKAGLMTFDTNFDQFIPAGRRKNQMQLIQQGLYNQTTDFGETDFSKLFVQIKTRIPQRSLLLLYSNFESIHSLDNQLPYFQKIARSHVLVVIFFINTELETLINSTPDSTEKIYQKVIAEKFYNEKKQIVRILNKYGIHAILTKPSGLTVNVINKYLELKSRNII